MSYTNGLDKPSDYFNTVLNTGDNTSPKSITGFNFQPDLVWTKTRTYGNNHTLFDSVRGAGSGKEISSNSTAEEGSATINTATYGYLSSFDSDGFTATSGSSGINYFNESGSTYVNWGWLAGGTGVSNTDGSITSTVSANTTSGFSIVSYTSDGNSGATVGHGLGVAPSVVIVKRRSSAEDWGVGHQSLGWTNFLRLNTTGASSASTGLWNDTAPSSTVVTLGNSGISNVGSGTTMIMYCFAEKKGFSKFGSYSGNGNADGTFVYTGFKPAFVMIKLYNTTVDNWYVQDSKRIGYNPKNAQLFPNTSGSENADEFADMLSNGFKLRDNGDGNNGSGYGYIYMAFAENPLVTSTKLPATAR